MLLGCEFWEVPEHPHKPHVHVCARCSVENAHVYIQARCLLARWHAHVLWGTQIVPCGAVDGRQRTRHVLRALLLRWGQRGCILYTVHILGCSLRTFRRGQHGLTLSLILTDVSTKSKSINLRKAKGDHASWPRRAGHALRARPLGGCRVGPLAPCGCAGVKYTGSLGKTGLRSRNKPRYRYPALASGLVLPRGGGRSKCSSNRESLNTDHRTIDAACSLTPACTTVSRHVSRVRHPLS